MFRQQSSEIANTIKQIELLAAKDLHILQVRPTKMLIIDISVIIVLSKGTTNSLRSETWTARVMVFTVSAPSQIFIKSAVNAPAKLDFIS